MTKIKIALLLFSAAIFAGCSDLIEYSPYDTDITNSNVNTANMEVISQSNVEDDTLRFAVFSDTHSYYGEFSDAVASINRQKGLQFVVCCGDLTESGLAQEFKWYYNIARNIKYPIITAIGNHDYLSNGSNIYTKMFGPTNFSFTNGAYKFVVFDDIVWENNNSSPNFEWLQSELSADTTKKCILIAHISTWSDEFIGDNAPLGQKYEDIIAQNKVMLCLHGHDHSYKEKVYPTHTSVITGSVSHRTYNIISLHENQFTLRQIPF
jgi:predicted phosphodiesterase